MSLVFLDRFHDRHAGASDCVFGSADTGDGRSSYARLRAVVPDDAGDVLDLACGDGPLLARLGDLPRLTSLVGLDANRTELAAAERRLGGSVRLVHGLAQTLPFADGSFDVVTSHMALMLMDEIEQVTAEIARVLRPGGTLAFVVGRAGKVAEVEAPIWHWLRERWRAEGLAMNLGDSRWRDATGIAEVLGQQFEGPVLTELNARVDVPIGQLFAFLERGYYPVDALSPEGKTALASFIADQADALAPDGTISWTFEMTMGTAARPRQVIPG